MTNSLWTPDASQQRVLSAGTGYHLVLAPPGCGKTQMLAERVADARLNGVEYGDMLCLTFTNRAARGMHERLQSRIGEDATELFVGNVHRFCSKFLFDNSLVAAESAVIDDNDAISILARYLGEDEQGVMANGSRRKAYSTIIDLSHLMRQIAKGHPKAVRAHSDALTSDDIAAMRTLCGIQRKEFTAATATDIYENAIAYETAIEAADIDMGRRHIIGDMLHKMKYAHAYEAYKRQNSLLDFEDLLINAYDALAVPNNYHKYNWIQIDEVQDLNMLQLAIIDFVTAKDATVVYLGDTQQAIFSFMGAKMETVDMLKERCKGNIYTLDTNHRSPSYLLDAFNTYATEVMGIDPALLPKAAIKRAPLPPGGGSSQIATPPQLTIPSTERQGTSLFATPPQLTIPSTERQGTSQFAIPPTGGQGGLTFLESGTIEEETAEVARLANDLYNYHPEETTAIIVNSNRDADAIGEALTAIGTPHFKVSGTDIFSTDDIKLLLAHYSVVANEFNFIAWARQLKGFGITQSYASARTLVRNLRNRALLPTDMLSADGLTYAERFAKAACEGEIVVFDTETTGTDIYNDDIIQIAAMKMCDGKIVEGSGLSLYIETDKPIPEMLGDIVNPIIEERKHQRLLSPQEALATFLEYTGSAPLLAHNATFDYEMMRFNLLRYLPDVDWQAEHPACFDSLKLSRLLFPGLMRYKLKNLIEYLGLEGENSHLADADVFATCGLASRCLEKAKEVLPEQKRFMRQGDMPKKTELLRHRYMPYIETTQTSLHKNSMLGKEPALVTNMRLIWQQLIADGYVRDNGKAEHIFSYLATDLMAGEEGLALRLQLERHAVEINTLREADLCGGASMKERLFVSTIHKAKGLEFDNVIVFDVVEGRYPNYYNANVKRLDDEDARKLYVAITRACKRLCISVSTIRKRYNGDIIEIKPSRFLTKIVDKLKD